jgi:hypothetical protein
MLKNYRKFLTAGVLAFGLAACGDDVTITEPAPPPPPPETPNIVSFSVAPTNATIAVGQTVQASYNLQTKAGVAGTVAFASNNGAVASVDAATGLITAVSNGTALISATATAGGQTATAQIGITVRQLQPAQISIQSVTQFANTVPVPLNNVAGQIEVNMNFDPGEQIVDSVNVFIGAKRAAKQAFVTNPAAGIISLSVNTANFMKNSTTGVATVDYQNGASTISAAVYPRGGAATATNTIAVVLNNQDGWAADMSAPSAFANNGAGLTYWGGPTAGGLTTATVYPVIYTPGRSIQTVSFNVGGCSNFVDTALPFRASFGYTAAGATAANCGGAGGYEYTGGARDNVSVNNAIDNTNNPFPLTPLIVNTVVPGSTPDSLRFDWRSPVVSTPSITRVAPAVTGWVNGSFGFLTFASTDNGVGIRATRDRAAFYNAPNCGGATNVAMPTGTGADIPECATNFIGGAVGLAATAPYRVYGTESDRLANVGQSGQTSFFGVDKTTPSIRWGTVEVPTYANASVSADTIFTNALPSTIPSENRVEYLDDRAGFFNAGAPSGGVAAQVHALSTAGHDNPTGDCVVGTGGPGAAFVTAQTCGMVAIGAVGTLRLDGWQGGQTVLVPDAEGYYGYRSAVTDAAGNTTATLSRKLLVNTQAPFATGLGLPAQLTNAAFPFAVTAADSAEVINVSLSLAYPGLPATDTLRYPQTAVGATFDDVITSPLATTLSPVHGAPFVRHLELVDGTAFPNDNISAVALNKPTAVQVHSFNPSNFSAESAVITIPALNVQNGQTITQFNAANPTISVNHWRLIPTLATSNQFGSTTPLRAQVSAPTNSPNPPFVRVDFYRLDASGDWHNYLGSVAGTSAIGTDQGTYRSWVYPLATAAFAKTWTGATQTAVVVTNTIAAIGVTANGDAVGAAFTF